MIRGLYTAANGMLTQQRRMDVVTNNLANAETIGYKEDRLLVRSFADMLVERLDDPSVVGSAPEVGPLNNGIHIDQIQTDHTGGALEETSQNTDLALIGDGYFVVQTPEGERYTRNGQFAVSDTGQLVTADGYPVLGEDGPVVTGSSTFTVDGSGRVQSPSGTAQIRLAYFDDPEGLRKEGGNLFSTFNAEETEGGTTQIRQGYLESSNVDLTRQVTDMIGIQRSHEINQRVVKMMDERLGRSVNDIGSL